MNWREAEAVMAGGKSVRRQSWAPDMIVRQEGERLMLHKLLPGLTRDGQKRGDGGWNYRLSFEASKAVDWEAAGG